MISATLKAALGLFRLAFIWLLSFAITPLFADYVLTSSTFEYDALGRVTKQVSEPSSAEFCKVTEFSYDIWGNQKLVKTYACAGSTALAANSVGIRQASADYTPTGGFLPSLTTNALGQSQQLQYDRRFGIPNVITDANNLSSNIVFDAFGRKVKAVDPDGTYTTWAYGWCSSPCFAPIVYGSFSSKPAWYVTEQDFGKGGIASGPSKTSFFNSLGKLIRTKQTGDTALGQASNIYQDYVYDPKGRLVYQTGIYANFADAPNSDWTKLSYDTLDRVVKQVKRNPDVASLEAVTTFTYNGLTTVTTNPLGQTRTTVKTQQGKDARITNALGQVITNSYNANNLLVQTNVEGVITQITYDRLGRKTGMSDPSLGVWQYSYNVLGELIQQTDSLNQTTKNSYDLLGRLIKREEPDLISEWIYDNCASSASACKGQLVEAKASNGYNRKHLYDNLARVIETQTTLEASAIPATVKVVYNASTAKMAKRVWPTGFELNYNYTSTGNLQTVSALVAGQNKTLWTAKQLDNKGRPTQYENGNGLVSNSIYTLNGIDTDHLVRQAVRVPGSNITVEKDYTYDALGNMLSRKTGYGTLATETAIAPITEAFQYDKINRLTGYQMVGGVSGSNISTQVQYDRIGNITFKSDVGSYSYDPARPYRLTQVALSAPSAAALLPSANKALNMLYDDGLPGAKSNGGVLMGNGNLRCTIIANSDGSRQARWQTYNSFNAPTQIALKTVDASFTCPANGALPTSPSTQLQFVYSPEHQRVKQVVTGGAQAGTTYYYNGNDSLDLSYEKTIKANGVTEHKHYISLPGSNGQWLLGQFVQRSGNLEANPASSRAAEEFNYFHQDAQGSTVAVSDANGQTLERMAYDPWGDRRSVTGPADPNNLITTEKTDRGYTQHEMLDEVGLVHMNGRIYDPTLGRMLTADILVSYPERSTSYNRYAYALNNPLRFVDPSGWEPHFGDNGYTEEGGKFDPKIKEKAYENARNEVAKMDFSINPKGFMIGGLTSKVTTIPNSPVSTYELGAKFYIGLHIFEPVKGKLVSFAGNLYGTITHNLEVVGYDRYLYGTGEKLILSDDETRDILDKAVVVKPADYKTFAKGNKLVEMEDGYSARVYTISTYHSPEIDGFIGSATGYVRNGRLIGFSDLYDMDSKKKGARSRNAEFATRLAHDDDAKPYKICGGIQPKGGC